MQLMQDVIAQFYQAAEPERGWHAAMASLTEALGGVQAGLQLCDPVLPGATRLLAAPGVSAEEVRLFVEHYQACDPFTQLGRTTPPGRSLNSSEVMADAELANTEYWNDFAQHHGRGFYLVGARIGLVGQELAMTGVLRPIEAGAFCHADQQRFDAVLPHIRQSLSLWHRLERARADAGAVSLMADALGACLICDGAGRLSLVSPAAEALAGAAGLRLTGGSLAFSRPEVSSSLRALIFQVATGGAGGTRIVTPGAAPGRAIVAHVGRLPRSGEPRAEPPHLVLVELRPVLAEAPSVASLRAMFGLGVAEAKVALLLIEGVEAEVVAARRGTSFNTVRAQIRGILGKTGTASLRELAALLLPMGRPRGE